jgi:hypothetical protein
MTLERVYHIFPHMVNDVAGFTPYTHITIDRQEKGQVYPDVLFYVGEG